MSRVVILRPEPGADATAERACTLGLDPVVKPLFTVGALAWTPPDPARFDALMVTSANAARYAGPELTHYAHLPLFVVGEATALACREQGLEPLGVGNSNAAALLADISQAGHRAVLHLCGADVVGTECSGLTITRMPVYHSVENRDTLSLQAHDVLLIHSPRAGERLAALVPPQQRSRLTVVAISPQALVAAGSGWMRAVAAPVPTDAAMLALARELCHKPGDDA